MPQSIIIPAGFNPDGKCSQPTDCFTGNVYFDALHSDQQTSIANVTFTPCARTHWHTHPEGQFIRVVAGNGWVCDKGGVPQRLRTGDVVWAPAGTTHWHGADDNSTMTHFVVGLGKTVWHDVVTDEEYSRKE
ncbi:cupin domain-containing protein [Aspergillus chevalieri]|uniref:Cupin type-2 domain-containing protein n=1 Tax=Aspergillus chevalieri TaxID=182096 RepID=A0A7R7VS95_ASPCH|nr:uncharacterized protein ACHE_51063A [Aspergillus chevalieri]BCR89865.1 hypothetical protein ACHE_51063A [Aspergillus chevalieri]